jgi:hypothetical protein
MGGGTWTGHRDGDATRVAPLWQLPLLALRTPGNMAVCIFQPIGGFPGVHGMSQSEDALPTKAAGLDACRLWSDARGPAGRR